MKSLKKKSKAEKEVHTAAVPHAEELEMEFEDDLKTMTRMRKTKK